MIVCFFFFKIHFLYLINSNCFHLERNKDNADNFYLRADFSKIEFNKRYSFNFPLITPEHESMCLSFIYLFSGSLFNEIRVLLVEEDKGKELFSYIWQKLSSYNTKWKKANINFSVRSQFRIIVELTNKDMRRHGHKKEIVAIDNLKISYGSCLKSNESRRKRELMDDFLIQAVERKLLASPNLFERLFTYASSN